jgi:hypothetical protein
VNWFVKHYLTIQDREIQELNHVAEYNV